MWQYNYAPSSDDIMHYGILGMRWGHRKASYHSTSIASAMARRSNKKVDDSFKNWNENSKKRADAIELGKKRNASKMAYESNKSDKSLKMQYKKDNQAYKKALKGNTTYRKGQVRQEVGADLSRKYLTEAKRVQKQMKTDSYNTQLQKKYNDLMSKHDVERARARRAPEVAANRSRKIASIKRATTMTVKAAATTAAIAAGTYAVNRYLNGHNVTLNGQRINVSASKISDFTDKIKKAKKAMGYVYY